MNLLLVGVVTKAHGLRGEVVVQPHHAGSPLWKPGLAMHGIARDVADRATDRVATAPLRSFVLRGCRSQITGGEQSYLCLFEGVATRDAADALRGLHLAVDETALPPAAPDEFYHHELRGYAVVDTAGTHLGTVVGVFPNPAQDLIEVVPPATKADPKPETWFVPFVSAIVTTVSRETRTITIDPPEGLVP